MDIDRAQIRRRKRLTRRAIRKTLCFIVAIMVLMTVPAVAIAESDVIEKDITAPVMMAAPVSNTSPVIATAPASSPSSVIETAPVPSSSPVTAAAEAPSQAPPAPQSSSGSSTGNAPAAMEIASEATLSPVIEPVKEPSPEPSQTQPAQQKSPASSTPAYKVKAKADGRSHIKINWSKVKGAAGYIVYRSTKSGKLGKKIYTAKRTDKRSWVDESPVIGETYYYTVKAWKKTNGKKTVLAAIHAKKVKNALKFKDSFEVKTYAYSGGGTTASGKKAREGLVAVDPNVIKLGTWLYIEGYGLCQAADTGGAIKGKKIDLYMDYESECINWGVRHKKVYILK